MWDENGWGRYVEFYFVEIFLNSEIMIFLSGWLAEMNAIKTYFENVLLKPLNGFYMYKYEGWSKNWIGEIFAYFLTKLSYTIKPTINFVEDIDCLVVTGATLNVQEQS